MKPKPLTRPSELVLSAIYNLDEVNGSTSEEIVEYISQNFDVGLSEIKEKVEAALKRGISFGLISQETSGLYKIRDLNEITDAPPKKRKRKRKRLMKHMMENFEDANISMKRRKKKRLIKRDCKNNNIQKRKGGESSGKSKTAKDKI